LNRLKIGETILKLRKERNITQDQLALMVGISAGAVSKWENGNSMPDISLLAPLARALNTSPDALLSFQRELSEVEITNIKEELTKLFFHEGYSAGEEKCKVYLNEYPNSINLKVVVAGLINTFLTMSGDDTEEFIENKRREALELFNQVAESGDSKYAPMALFFIAHINMILENYEESEKALKKLPQYIDPATLYPYLFLKQGKYEEAIKFCSNKLLNYVNNSCLMLSALSGISKKEQDYEKALFYLDTCYKIQNIFQIGLLSSVEYKYVQLYIETDNKKLAAQWFKTYVEGIISGRYDYSSNPYFEKVELEIKPEEQKIARKNMIQSMIENEEFKALVGILEYEEAIRELKITLSEM